MAALAAGARPEVISRLKGIRCGTRRPVPDQLARAPKAWRDTLTQKSTLPEAILTIVRLNEP